MAARAPDAFLRRQLMRSVLYTAQHHGHDALVLGALGCHLKHDPALVARDWKALLQTEFRGWFRAVVVVAPANKQQQVRW